jgi:Uma2 family endonuclease
MRNGRRKREATYEDLHALPENCTGEIVDGELWVTPRPRVRHAKTHSRLLAKLSSSFDPGGTGPGGWVILLEPELLFGRNILIPDIGGWQRGRFPEDPDAVSIEVVPDWVCEILSPTTSRFDRQLKMRVYAEQGVPNAWLVDPLAQTIESYELISGRYTLESVHGGDAKARIPPFSEIELDLPVFWDGPPAPSGVSEPDYVIHDLRASVAGESLR